jgi:hypothetical protein
VHDRTGNCGGGDALCELATIENWSIHRFTWKPAFLFRFDLAGATEGLPVLFGLVGVEQAKSGESIGERLTISEIAGDDKRIAGARMTARQELSADFAERHQAGAGEIGEFDGALMVIELTDEELARAEVRPAKKRI